MDITSNITLALTKSILDAYVMTDAYEQGEVLEETVLSLIADLDKDESHEFPQAFENCMRALECDLVRWRAAGDLALRLDLYELVPYLIDGCRRNRDIHQLSNLITLSTNPLVMCSDRENVVRIYDGGIAPPDSVKRMIEVRLGKLSAESDFERFLASQVWPGSTSTSDLRSVAPLVFVADRSDRSQTFNVIAAIANAGGRIRRISSDHEYKRSSWASPDCPLVHWSGKELGAYRGLIGKDEQVRSVLVTSESTPDTTDTLRMLRSVQSALPSGVLLRRRPSALEVLPQAFSREVLEAGAYDSYEMSYLGASSKTTLTRAARDGLSPVSDTDVNRWRFNQLVAFRLVSGFRAQKLNFDKNAGSLVAMLSGIADANDSHSVGIGSDGSLFIDDGSGFRNISNGQQALVDVLRVDDAFRPFDLGGGRAPDLLRPGRFTTVHPLTLGGTPCVEGHRISARTLANAVQRGRGTDLVLRSAYPELSAEKLSDGLRVGQKILAAG